ncbi:TetR/AcrR family transcriptional regulator [Leptospira sp. GIMC2001]|uniref:TetR/AcrR family transcriptional regulator n=1 Tax=Leptospira sp. GIMC2001 TaxID=1513297 RepID=UPI00234B5246|nr:TetR/AcrR family transcriptional regulator [Leptospira sp. GIMC2001]WCL49225.1 helix-turn-helix domain containing protein [Leptospira sp. GIMC2001]
MQITEKILKKEFEKYKNPQSEKEILIIQAGEKLFSQKGYAATTTAELAKLASVTERTLFKYFPNKSLLYLRILSGLLYMTILPNHMQDLKDRLTKIEGSYKEWYLSLIRARFQAASQNRDKVKLLIDALLHEKSFAKIFGKLWKENLFDSSVKAIEHFQNKGEIRGELDPTAVARASYSLMASFIVYRFALGIDIDHTDEAEALSLINIFIQGIGERK